MLAPPQLMLQHFLNQKKLNKKNFWHFLPRPPPTKSAQALLKTHILAIFKINGTLFDIFVSNPIAFS